MIHFFKDMESFANNLIAELQALELTDLISEIDHVCYRVSDSSSYEAVKLFVSKYGSKISEALVNGRPIATYKLFKPVDLAFGFRCQLVEIPSPKSGRNYQEGFEHIEAVTNIGLEEFIHRRSDLEFNVENSKALINPDISYRFKSGLVKFHETSLEKIIEIEEKNI